MEMDQKHKAKLIFQFELQLLMIMMLFAEPCEITALTNSVCLLLMLLVCFLADIRTSD